VVLVEDRFWVVDGVKDCLKIVAPLVHLGVNFRRGVRVCLSMIDRLVAQFDYQAFDLSVSHEEL